jgi:hypothetical protein
VTFGPWGIECSLDPIDRTHPEINEFLAYDDEFPETREPLDLHRIIVDVDGSRVTIRVGTIASIKGQTHDATLILDTDFRSMKSVQKAVKHAFARGAKKGRLGIYQEQIIANVYVAATRPRRLLALACRADGFGAVERGEALARGWHVIEVPGARKPVAQTRTLAAPGADATEIQASRERAVVLRSVPSVNLASTGEGGEPCPSTR